MPDTAAYCPGCGRSMRPVERARGTVGLLPEKVAGAVAYFLVPAIVFLLAEPYSKNRFVRFHSFQCLFFALAVFAIHIALSILTVVPFVALVTLPLHLLVSLGAFVLWIVLLLKANQGQMYKLPIIGDLAEKQANAI